MGETQLRIAASDFPGAMFQQWLIAVGVQTEWLLSVDVGMEEFALFLARPQLRQKGVVQGTALPPWAPADSLWARWDQSVLSAPPPSALNSSLKFILLALQP